VMIVTALANVRWLRRADIVCGIWVSAVCDAVCDNLEKKVLTKASIRGQDAQPAAPGLTVLFVMSS
jgi:hypothetical protein